MRILALTTVTVNLITFLMGAPVHTPMEIESTHAIYAKTFMVEYTEVYDQGTETVEDDEGLIILVDANGNEWSYEEYPEDYYVGDYVAVLMDDNGTPGTIYDDKIIDVRASGFYK